MRDGVDVLLVCSPGGHLLQLVSVKAAWAGRTRAWVTLEAPDARSLLAGEHVMYAHGPTNRSAWNLIRNLGLAWRLVRQFQPRVLVTTGAGVAVPFAWAARFCGAEVVYIESLTRIDSISLSCRLIRPVASRVYAQWPELRRIVPEARYAGTVLSR